MCWIVVKLKCLRRMSSCKVCEMLAYAVTSCTVQCHGRPSDCHGVASLGGPEPEHSGRTVTSKSDEEQSVSHDDVRLAKIRDELRKFALLYSLRISEGGNHLCCQAKVNPGR